LHRNDLTAEGAENAEGENTEMNNSDATGFDIISQVNQLKKREGLLVVTAESLGERDE
jgi:hypothetical protein